MQHAARGRATADTSAVTPRAPAVKKTAKTGAAKARTAKPVPAKSSARRDRTSSAGDEIAGVAISNPDKVLYPEAGITKRELAQYYAAVGERMLPYVAGRPLTLVRCPNGWKHCFYQKHAKEPLGPYLETVDIREAGGTGVYLMANSVSAIVALLQMGVLEVHPWGSRAGSLDHPDRIVMDFDPDESLPWQAVVDAVTVQRQLLDSLGLVGYLKTTGGKGLHVVVPIAPTHDWDTVRAFAKAMADLMVATFPDRYVATLTKSKRSGKILVDYLRNAENATAVAPYSLRAKANAPVSMPIAWDELGEDVRFDHFNVRTAQERIGRKRKDPWAGFFELEQAITPAMLRQLHVAKT
jgi:bifunctional non-homologous end joining protein LigD